MVSEFSAYEAAPYDEPEQTSADLRRMRFRASALLVLVTAVFVIVKATTDGGGCSGYVEAAAEAAMVGGVADWFAVTALFRHPLGIPIPHTAIIPKRKDQIGRSLGAFVQDNFLNGDLVAGRVRDFGVAARLGDWMAQPANAAKLGEQASVAIGGVTEVLNDDDVSAGVEAVLVRRLEAVSLSSLASRALEVAIEGNHHQAVLDATMRSVNNVVTDNDQVLRKRLYEESPWWVPESIDDRVFDKIRSGVTSLMAEVLADPGHDIRQLFDQRARTVAVELRESEGLAARGEELKAELLDHPDVRAWLSSLWEHLKVGLLEAAEDRDSELRERLEAAIVTAGLNMRADPALQAKVDRWVEGLIRYAVGQSHGEVAALIASTVQRWDSKQTGERIELQVGRDLQFIRINGTVVGALVGLVIHTVATLI